MINVLHNYTFGNICYLLPSNRDLLSKLYIHFHEIFYCIYNTEDLFNSEWAQIPLFIPLGTDKFFK